MEEKDMEQMDRNDPRWLMPNLGVPNPALEEEARELGQFNIELLGAYAELERLRAQGGPSEKIDEWLEDLAISTRGIQQTTARITQLVRDEHLRYLRSLPTSRGPGN